MKRFSFVLIALLTLVLSFAPAKAAYFNGDQNPSVASELKEDAFIAGDSVSITAPIAGEVFAAGNTVTLSKAVARSLFAAGNTVSVDQGAGYNAFVAGQTVTLSGEYGHDVYVAGSNVVIKEGTVIKGDLRAAGSTITLAGTINGNVDLGGATVTSSAVIGGYLKGETGKLSFTGGSIGKDLIYHSDVDATNLDKVAVAGKTERQTPTHRFDSTKEAGIFLGAAAISGWLYKLLSTLLLGAVIILLFRSKISDMSDIITTQWSRALGLGVVGLIVTPIAAVVLMATLIAWKIGLALLLGYFAWILIVPIYGLFVAGSWILKRLGDSTPNIWAVMLVGVVVASVLTALPFVGGLFGFAIHVALTLPALGASIIWGKKMIAAK